MTKVMILIVVITVVLLASLGVIHYASQLGYAEDGTRIELRKGQNTDSVSPFLLPYPFFQDELKLYQKHNSPMELEQSIPMPLERS